MSKISPKLAGGSVGVVTAEPLPASTLPPSPPSASARVGPHSPAGTVGTLANHRCPPPPSADTPISVPTPCSGSERKTPSAGDMHQARRSGIFRSIWFERANEERGAMREEEDKSEGYFRPKEGVGS